MSSAIRTEKDPGLRADALGLVESVIMGVAGSGPAYSVAVSTATLIAAAWVASHAPECTELTVEGDRGFESGSLQRRVCLSGDFIFGGQEPRLSARVSRLRSRRGRQRAAGPANIAPTRSSISVGLYSSTAFPAMRSRQVVGLKSQGGFPNEIGLALGLGMLVDLASSDCAQAKPSAAR